MTALHLHALLWATACLLLAASLPVGVALHAHHVTAWLRTLGRGRRAS